jgi:hypothetical protein
MMVRPEHAERVHKPWGHEETFADVEVSTAAPGWRQDIVRLEDRYGRGGSSIP